MAYLGYTEQADFRLKEALSEARLLKQAHTLASVLSRHVGRVVIDRTGLKGYYNFTLQWTADDLDASGTALFQAIEEQLGLKLEAAKAPLEILVIERAERPSEN